MGLITEEVEVTLPNNNVKWYESNGYYIPRQKDKRGRIVIQTGAKIIVKVNDLLKNSRVKVKCRCDNCNKEYETSFAVYNKCVKNDGKIYCQKCAVSLYGREISRLSFLKTRISFEQWCINNNRQDILDRWDYELNNCSPSEIGHSPKAKHWLKCPCGIHKSELKDIASFVSSNQDGSVKCNACNSIGQWLINNYGDNAIKLYLSEKNKINPFEISYSSTKSVWFICQKCGEEKLMPVYSYIHSGIMCHKCSDGISYNEKLMYQILKQLNKEFSTQASKKTYKWCNNFKYDFYVIENNEHIIIETHGIQHYEESGRGRSLREEQENDKLKEQLAKANNIKHYIVLDCRKSELEWIKKSVMESELPTLFHFKEDDINWLECHEYACKSFVKIACDLYNEKLSIFEISNKLKLSKQTIRKYLKQGFKIDLCDYNAKEALLQSHKNNSKKIYCVELDKLFNSEHEAEIELNICSSNLSKCCKGITKTSGGYHWMYYEDYLKLNNNELSNCEKSVAFSM